MNCGLDHMKPFTILRPLSIFYQVTVYFLNSLNNSNTITDLNGK